MTWLLAGRLSFIRLEVHINMDKVKTLEKIMGGNVPYLFIEHLRNSQSGRYKGLAFNLPDGTSSILQRIFTLHSGPDDIVEQYSIYKERLPKYFLPIGIDTCGNLIAFYTKDGNKVCFFDHEEIFLDTRLKGIDLGLDVISFFESLHRSNVGKADVELMIEDCSIDFLRDKIENGLNPEVLDVHGRNLVEQAVIKNRIDIVKYLLDRGFSEGRSLFLAEDNYSFFPEFKEIVELLKSRRI